METLSNTEAELKKSIAYKKAWIFRVSDFVNPGTQYEKKHKSCTSKITLSYFEISTRETVWHGSINKTM